MSSRSKLLQEQTRQKLFQEPGIPCVWVCEFEFVGAMTSGCTSKIPHKYSGCTYYTEDEIEEKRRLWALKEVNAAAPPVEVAPLEEVKSEARRKADAIMRKALEEAYSV